jgi:hypothetical protein
MTLRPEYVEFIPDDPAAGILYISEKYRVAIHLCPCGCGNQVVTPLEPGRGWDLSGEKGVVTLRPSIGSWNLPCRSHYFITANSVQWS